MNQDNISIIDIICSSGGLKMKLVKSIDMLFGGILAYILPSLPACKRPVSVKRILIIRPGGIGDAVFLLPIIRQLKYQGIEIDVLCERRNIGVFLSQNELLKTVYLYTRVRDVFSIFAKRYDAIIDTEQWHLLSGILTYFLRTSLKVGFSTRPLRAKLYNVCVRYDQNYELNNFQLLFGVIFENIANKPLELAGSFLLPDIAVSWIRNEKRWTDSIALFLGASIPERRLTLDEWKGMIQFLLSQKKVPVLIGGSDALVLSESLMQVFGDSIINYVGKLDLGRSAAVISSSSLFIGTDSGLLHIAAALGIPTLSIFGPGNAVKWAPKGEKHKVISMGLACSPCTRFGYTLPVCSGAVTCMRSLDVLNELKRRFYDQG
ncbi:MAG: glycosyltransferase family 9 protein [Candidatus Omnitrophica bacterium]|nr:glycosyltransferase family 9 protein [Candidatus Omnitrophota bacterium]